MNVVKINLENIRKTSNFFEIKKRGYISKKIFLFRIQTYDTDQFIEMIQKKANLACTIGDSREIVCSLTIEVKIEKVHIFCITNDPKVEYRELYNTISFFFRSNFGVELEELNGEDVKCSILGN